MRRNRGVGAYKVRTTRGGHFPRAFVHAHGYRDALRIAAEFGGRVIGPKG